MTSPTVLVVAEVIWTIPGNCAEPELGEVSAWSLLASVAAQEVARIACTFSCKAL
jgi:hypothetical protein